MEISWKGASGFRDRIRRRAVFEKLGYGRTGAVTLISAHLCPRLRVHVLRVSRPAKHRNRAQCTAEFHSVYTQARAHARTNLPFPSLHTSGCVPRVVHRGCLLCLVVNSSSTIIFFFFFLYRSLLETPPRSRNRYSRKFSGENFSLDFFQKIDGCRIIEIHTDISSRISSFFSSTGMINGIGREREKGFVFVKNLSLEETSSKLFYFFFFSLVSLTRGVMPGYLIIFCKMNFSFLLFYASLIMIYRVILMSPG